VIEAIRRTADARTEHERRQHNQCKYRRQPGVAVGRETEEDDVTGHNGDEHVPQPEIRHRVDKAGADSQGQQTGDGGSHTVQKPSGPEFVPAVTVGRAVDTDRLPAVIDPFMVWP